MAKRQADSYLTDRNWDDEDEAQEAGEFKKADQGTLAARKIKTAKRRTDGSSETSGTGGIFKAFTGFTSSSSTAPKSGAFCFGGIQPKCLGSNSSDTALGSTKNGAEVTSTKADTSSTSKNGTEKSKNSKYMSQLKALNSSVAKWITEHVDSNPYCILTPIFTDYEKHLKEIEQKYGEGAGKEADKFAPTSSTLFGAAKDSSVKDDKESSPAKPESSVSPFTSPATTTAPAGLFSFGGKSPAAPAFTFGGGASSNKPLGAGTGGTLSTLPAFGASTSSTSDSTSSSTPSSSTATSSSLFGTGAFGGAAGTSGFTFNKTGDTTTGVVTSTGSSSAFTFGTVKPAASGDGGSEATSNNDEDEYVPPEPEPSSITEDDAFYTKRCKLFYKVGSDWKDYGVGNLFLKPCEERTQLLVRADTSLGNILLNILIPATFPASRNGKNNVLIMCVPNPPLKDKKVEADKPMSMLVRVKTAEEADELLEKLKEAKEKAGEKQ